MENSNQALLRIQWCLKFGSLPSERLEKSKALKLEYEETAKRFAIANNLYKEGDSLDQKLSFYSLCLCDLMNSNIGLLYANVDVP